LHDRVEGNVELSLCGVPKVENGKSRKKRKKKVEAICPPPSDLSAHVVQISLRAGSVALQHPLLCFLRLFAAITVFQLSPRLSLFIAF
jgi:hypothetical protein